MILLEFLPIAFVPCSRYNGSMMRNKTSVGDSVTIARKFVEAVETRTKKLGYSDKFTIGYLQSFIAMNADKGMTAAMEDCINTLGKEF